MISFENKLVAVMNKSIEPGKVMNALAHLCIGLGANLGKESLNLINFEDKEGNIYPNISKMPFIILSANSNKILALSKLALENKLHYAVFTDTMTGGTWEEQVEKTKTSSEQNLTALGIVLFGEWPLVTTLTKKFSLWK